MAAARQDEVERTYDVAGAAVLPPLGGLEEVGVVGVGAPVDLVLEAVYFDTAGLDLLRRGITLRRRAGGDDAGWHLKTPGGPDTRTETRLPLGRAVTAVPARLVEVLRAVVRDRPLEPVARIRTRRREYPLLGEDRVVLARVCDDEVHAERLDGTDRDEQWREWEVELVEADRSLLDRVEARLREAGASPASRQSKLSRVLAGAVREPAPRPSGEDLARGSTAQLLLALVVEQTAQLERHDTGVRTETASSVHRLRIAARRLRSALRTYRTVLDPDVADRLREDLRWLGQALGQARDAQVLGERMGALLAGQPRELVLGPVATRIDDELRVAHRAGLDHGRQALSSERYFRLLDRLDELVAAPPLTSEAATSARDLVPQLLARDARRLRRAVAQVGRTDDPAARDLALHEARKKAKRLRYAAESAVPVFGARAEKYAGRVKRVQQALGRHQDSVVARRMLREYGVQAHLSGQNGFTYGRLHALEQWRGQRAEEAFEKAWKALPGSSKVARWIRG
jgi:CHAD domain-containing protein